MLLLAAPSTKVGGGGSSTTRGSGSGEGERRQEESWLPLLWPAVEARRPPVLLWERRLVLWAGGWVGGWVGGGEGVR
jgi:hypothetical protein